MSANPIWIAGYFGPVAGASPVWIAPGDGTVPSAVQSEIVSFFSPVAGATAVWIAAYGGPPPAGIGATPIIISGWGGSGGGVDPPHDWSRVQGVLNASGGATSTTLTLPAAVTNGNIVVGSLFLISSFVTNITDDKGNAYQIVNADGSQDGVSNLQVTGFCSAAPVTNGPKTLTITYPNSAVSWGIVEEFTAGAPLPAISIDGAQLLIRSGANTTPNFQTLQSNDLLWSASFDSANVTAGAGWTAGLGNGGQQMSMWKQGGAPSGSVAALIVQSSQVWTTVFGVAPVARSSWLLRQNQIQRTNGGGVSGSVTFPNTIAPGSYVIGTVALGTSAGHVSDIVSIVDDKGNSYSIIPGYIDASGRAMFWSGGPLANGPKTITCTTSVSESLIYFLINEFVPPPGTTSVSIDGTPTMITVPGGSSYTSGSVTTSANGDLLYSEADLVGGGALPTNGFSTINGQGVTWCDAYFIQKSAGSVAAGWSAGTAGAANTIGLVAFSASSVAPTHSPQALAYLARTVGGNEGGNGANIATLIDGLVSDGVWGNLDALYVLAQQNQSDANLNLIGTSYPLTVLLLAGQRAASFTPYVGYTVNNGGGATGFIPSTAVSPKYVLNSASYGFWAYNAVSGAYNVMYSGSGPSGLYYNYTSSPNLTIGSVNGPQFTTNSPNAVGLYAEDRSASNNFNNFYNGVSQGSSSGASTTLDTQQFIFGGASTQTHSAAFIGASLGAAGQLALYNRLRTYLTAVGVP